MKELTGLILMAVLGTYYFCRKKTDRKKALFCKAAATSVPGILLAVSMIEGNVQNVSAGGNGTGFTVAAGATLAAIVFYMAADVLSGMPLHTGCSLLQHRACVDGSRLFPEPGGSAVF